MVKGSFLNINIIPENDFLGWSKCLKKRQFETLAKIVQKWLLVTFPILTVEVSKKTIAN